jgi:hypothetical protein
VISLALVFVGCDDEARVLQLKDVQFFKMDQKSSSPLRFEMSGLAFHSALAVEKILARQVGTNLTVKVYLTRARGDLSGRFKYEFEIPEAVTRVLFGTSRDVVWKREGT